MRSHLRARLEHVLARTISPCTGPCTCPSKHHARSAMRVSTTLQRLKGLVDHPSCAALFRQKAFSPLLSTDMGDDKKGCSERIHGSSGCLKSKSKSRRWERSRLVLLLVLLLFSPHHSPTGGPFFFFSSYRVVRGPRLIQIYIY